jgi:hypothetical protein
MVRERAFGELQEEGVAGLDVRAIESIALWEELKQCGLNTDETLGMR